MASTSLYHRPNTACIRSSFRRSFILCAARGGKEADSGRMEVQWTIAPRLRRELSGMSCEGGLFQRRAISSCTDVQVHGTVNFMPTFPSHLKGRCAKILLLEQSNWVSCCWPSYERPLLDDLTFDQAYEMRAMFKCSWATTWM